MNCLSCKFFYSEESECRRYPPTLYSFDSEKSIGGGDYCATLEVESAFPKTLTDWWCGEFKANEGT